MGARSGCPRFAPIGAIEIRDYLETSAMGPLTTARRDGAPAMERATLGGLKIFPRRLSDETVAATAFLALITLLALGAYNSTRADDAPGTAQTLQVGQPLPRFANF